MSLHYIIDGYNITKHRLFPLSSLRNKDPLFLLSDLIKSKKLCGSLKNKVELVFDGYPINSDTRSGDCQINPVFSYDISADEKIKSSIEKSTNRKNTIVVTDDREIVSFARAYHVKTVSAKEFLAAANEQMAKEETARNLKNNHANKELNYSQVNSINEELKKRWLK